MARKLHKLGQESNCRIWQIRFHSHNFASVYSNRLSSITFFSLVALLQITNLHFQTSHPSPLYVIERYLIKYPSLLHSISLIGICFPTIPHSIVFRSLFRSTFQDDIFGPVVCAYVYNDNQIEQVMDLVDSTTDYALTGRSGNRPVVWFLTLFTVQTAFTSGRAF